MVNESQDVRICVNVRPGLSTALANTDGEEFSVTPIFIFVFHNILPCFSSNLFYHSLYIGYIRNSLTLLRIGFTYLLHGAESFLRS